MLTLSIAYICAGRRGGGTGQPGRHHIGQLQLEGKLQGNLREMAKVVAKQKKGSKL